LIIGSNEISDASRCYVIAEIGHNHQGSVDTCKELFWEAKHCGVSGVKLQKRNNRALYTREMYGKPYENENSFGATYGQHREALELDFEQYRALKDYARELKLDFFATAFDHASADFLEALDVPAFKIASGDVKNTPLIAHVASFGKPVIVSTGAATLEDVQRVYDTVMRVNPRLCLLQCTAGYPASFDELDLAVITQYRERFPGAVVGFSGHDNGIAMAVAAYVLGARVIEKHFTLNRAMKGTDHAFSLEPVGMRKMVRDLDRTRRALGDGVKKVYASEASPAYKMGKKLVAARDLPAGHVLGPGDIAIKSPGDGLPPCELPRVLGHLTLRPLREDEALTLELVAEATREPSIQA
jgi:N-acetylneuraminate synthase/sialic acid synthase